MQEQGATRREGETRVRAADEARQQAKARAAATENEQAQRSLQWQQTVLSRQVQVKREQLEEVKQTHECTVCMDAPVRVLLEPCMHLCLSESCPQGPHCPLCRTAVRKHTRVFGQL